MSKPRIYLASKLHHAAFMRQIKEQFSSRIDVVSTWHDNLNVEQEDANSDDACRKGWEANWEQVVCRADGLIAFGNKEDKLNGTMIEIGMAFGKEVPVYLVGSYPWGTWKILDHVYTAKSHEEAIEHLTAWNK